MPNYIVTHENGIFKIKRNRDFNSGPVVSAAKDGEKDIVRIIARKKEIALAQAKQMVAFIKEQEIKMEQQKTGSSISQSTPVKTEQSSPIELVTESFEK